MLNNITRITTDDTKKTYDFPDASAPAQIWELKLTLTCLSNCYGRLERGTGSTAAVVHLERKTIEDHGLRPRVETRKNVPVEETPADLAIKFLASIGVYPTE